VHANSRLFFNILNTLAAYTVLQELELPFSQTEIASALSRQEVSRKIYEVIPWRGRTVYVVNNKAENASTFNQSMLFASSLKDPLILVVGWKEISRRYNSDDLAWLFDVNFELVANQVVYIICTGIDADTIAMRLKYAGVAEENISVAKEVDSRLIEQIAHKPNTVVAALNFDHIEPFKEALRG